VKTGTHATSLELGMCEYSFQLSGAVENNSNGLFKHRIAEHHLNKATCQDSSISGERMLIAAAWFWSER